MIKTVNKYLFGFACFALPWVDFLPISIYLFSMLTILLLYQAKMGKIRMLIPFPNVLMTLFLIYYLLQIQSYFVHPNAAENRFALEQKFSFLFIPLFLSIYNKLMPEGWVIGVGGYIVGNLLACVFCLCNAIIHFSKCQDFQVFFYHQYSSAIKANAIYFSLHLLISILLLFHYNKNTGLKLSKKWLHILLVFFSINILLLSSKMLIFIGVILLILYLMYGNNIKSIFFLGTVFTTLFLLLLLTDNPVKKRYNDFHFNSYKNIMHQQSFNNYNFNGFDLRLLLWKMGYESLNENNGWFWGLGGKSYRHILNNKIKSYQMFSGNQITKDTGYINYDMHSQFVENLMQSGIFGLSLLLVILLFIVFSALKQKNFLLLLMVFVFSGAFLTESVLETQSGILLFTIFIYGEWNQLTSAKKHLKVYH